MQVETRKGLNLLMLMMHFPRSMEPVTAACLQLDREATARAEHHREMRSLRATLKGWASKLPKSHQDPFAGGVESNESCGGVSSHGFTQVPRDQSANP